MKPWEPVLVLHSDDQYCAACAFHACPVEHISQKLVPEVSLLYLWKQRGKYSSHAPVPGRHIPVQIWCLWRFRTYQFCVFQPRETSRMLGWVVWSYKQHMDIRDYTSLFASGTRSRRECDYLASASSPWSSGCASLWDSRIAE